jgi:hypothetical protein
VPTKSVAVCLAPSNSDRKCASSNVFTCPHGGFLWPQVEQVVRPSLKSCLYGTPIRTVLRVTRRISRQTEGKMPGGTCSRTSAQSTRSNEPFPNGNCAAFPCTQVTRGSSDRGVRKSSATTSSNRSASNRDK